MDAHALGQFRVWWIPQVPMTPFHVAVSTVDEGAKVLELLAAYDLFQLMHHVKGDFSNAGGLEEYADGEWIEWNDPESGDDIGAYMEAERG